MRLINSDLICDCCFGWTNNNREHKQRCSKLDSNRPGEVGDDAEASDI